MIYQYHIRRYIFSLAPGGVDLILGNGFCWSDLIITNGWRQWVLGRGKRDERRRDIRWRRIKGLMTYGHISCAGQRLLILPRDEMTPSFNKFFAEALSRVPCLPKDRMRELCWIQMVVIKKSIPLTVPIAYAILHPSFHFPSHDRPVLWYNSSSPVKKRRRGDSSPLHDGDDPHPPTSSSSFHASN